MKPLRQQAPEELSRAYAFAADLAEQRRRESIARRDRKEASAWRSIATYCSMMAKTRRLDAPDSDVAYVAPATEIVLNLRVLSRIMAREDTDSVWTAEKQLALAAALYVLSSTERVVAEMYYGGLLDVPHIANALRTTSGTIEGYLTRIRKKWDKLRAGIG